VTTDIAKEWLLNWFQRKKSLPGPAEKQLELNYFQEGLIDSFGITELIVDVEEQFGIEFSDVHFQDRRFSLIGGLAEIIAELKEG